MARSAAVQRRLVLFLAAGCLACATAPHEGDSVHVAEESALIVWDAAARTQHFIRRASFETTAKDFGFLVPTPSVPDLAEADDAAFRLLEDLTRIDLQRDATRKAPAAAPKAEVAVLKQVKVAGYDATVLAASDASALDEWLKKNGYPSSPELVDWYKPYIDKGWIITAFKIAQDAGATRLDSSAVRMSFKTEAPFFPYKEPASAGGGQGGGRLLQVFFLGDARPEGKVGADAAWPGRTVWSGQPDTQELDKLWSLARLPGTRPAALQRLTEFRDGSAPCPGNDDLYFAAAPHQSAVPDPRVLAELKTAQRQSTRSAITIVALILALLAGAVGFFVYRRATRK
jgi:hypothetical protein